MLHKNDKCVRVLSKQMGKNLNNWFIWIKNSSFYYCCTLFISVKFYQKAKLYNVPLPAPCFPLAPAEKKEKRTKKILPSKHTQKSF